MGKAFCFTCGVVTGCVFGVMAGISALFCAATLINDKKEAKRYSYYAGKRKGEEGDEER